MGVLIVQQERIARQRKIAVALICLLAIVVLALAADATTIRIVPDASSLTPPAYAAFPGERIRVELDGGWTPVRSSDSNVVAPAGGNWFVALDPGSATLSAVSLRCRECLIQTIVWRATVKVGIPGT